MSRIAQVSAALLVLVLLVSCAASHDCGPTCCGRCCPDAVAAAPEPSRDGRTLSEWAAQAQTADGPTRTEAVDELGAIGPAAWCAADAMAGADDPGTRAAGLQVLGRLGPDARASLPKIQAALHERDAALRAEAAHALIGLGREAAPAIPDLAPLVTDEHWAVRYQVLRALGACGWHAWNHRELLDHAAHEDLDPIIRRTAAEARADVLEDWFLHNRGLVH